MSFEGLSRCHSAKQSLPTAHPTVKVPCEALFTRSTSMPQQNTDMTEPLELPLSAFVTSSRVNQLLLYQRIRLSDCNPNTLAARQKTRSSGRGSWRAVAMIGVTLESTYMAFYHSPHPPHFSISYRQRRAKCPPSAFHTIAVSRIREGAFEKLNIGRCAASLLYAFSQTLDDFDRPYRSLGQRIGYTTTSFSKPVMLTR